MSLLLQHNICGKRADEILDQETSVEWPVSFKEKYGERHRINHKGNKLRGKGAHGGHPSTFSAGSGAELHRSCSNRFTATRNKPSDGLRHLEIPLPLSVVPLTQIPFLRPAIPPGPVFTLLPVLDLDLALRLWMFPFLLIECCMMAGRPFMADHALGH